MDDYAAYRNRLRNNRDAVTITELCEQFPKLNPWHFWMMLNDDDYKPSRRVAKILGLHKPRRRLVIDLPPDTPADELEYIRSLTREERRERLLR